MGDFLNRMVGKTRSARLATTISLTITVVLGVVAPAAFAAEGHVFAQAFGKGELAVGFESGIALNQETGELYVADTGNSRVAKFTAAGAPDGSLATVPTPTFIAADNSTSGSSGDLYVVNSANTKVTKFSAAGAVEALFGSAGSLTGIGELYGVAVDSSGNLWTIDKAAIIREFTSAGVELTHFQGGFEGATPNGLAVDLNQHLYFHGGSDPLFGHLTAVGPQGESFKPDLGRVPPSNNDGPVRGAFAIEPGTENVVRGGVSAGSGRPGNELGAGLTIVGANQQTIEEFGEHPEEESFLEISGIAVRGGSSEIYVVVQGEVQAYPVEDVGPPTPSIDSPTAVTTTSAHLAGHINPNAPAGNPPAYEVTWSFTCTPSPCKEIKGGTIAPDSSDHVVEATLEGLEAGTEYTVVLHANNILNKTTAAESFVTAPIAPEVLKQSATHITATEAELHAVLNPRGAGTTYRFQYVPEAAFFAEGFNSPQTVSAPEGGPTAQAGQQEVSVAIGGLTPGIAYRYRTVATNSVGTTPGAAAAFSAQAPLQAPEICPNQAFRTFFGAGLPDCRAYEMVSPVAKNGVAVEGYLDYFGAASDGSGVTYFSQSAVGIPASGGAHQEFATMLGLRGGQSWDTQRLLPPEYAGVTANFLGASEDFRYALLEGCLPGVGTGAGCALYLEETASQSLIELVPHEENQVLAPTYGEGSYAYDSISKDGSRVFFETKAHLTPNAAEGKDNLYMWNRATGEVALAGVQPGPAAKAPTGGDYGGAYSWWNSPTVEVGGALNGQYVEAIHAISEDGDKAYFTAGLTGQLYLRRNLTTSNPSTLQVSAPESGVTDPNGTKPAAFQEASPDGSVAFFVSSQKLTKASTTGGTDAGADLYRYDAVSRTITDVTPDTAAIDPNGAEVQGLLGASTQGTSGYLVAKGILAPGGTKGEFNIYRFEDRSGGQFTYTFVGNSGGRTNWSNTSSGPIISPSNEEYKSSRVTPDGGTLVYSSPGPSRSAQLYMYSTSLGGPFCVSCNPTGEPSNGPSTLSTSDLNAHLPVRGLIEQRLTRNLTPDGNHLFFNSPDSLVTGDTNADPRCTYYLEVGTSNTLPDCSDVYEWEAPGAPGGSCHSAEVNHGCLYLLSTGKSKDASNLIDASADGKDVFIATSSQLVPIDQDDLFDVYDVSVGRGLASQQVTATPPCSSAQACQGPSAPESSGDSAGTTTFNGPGNQNSVAKKPPCKKGAKKKCPKKKAGKHGKKRHGKIKKRKQGGKSHGRRAQTTKSGGVK